MLIMILHLDMDAFYASVEIRDDPALSGKPIVVGGSPKGRGVVSAASYEARKFGIHSAMPTAHAYRLCKHAIFIKPRMQHYANISKQIREIFFRFTSLVEPLSLDEAFLDVSGCERLFAMTSLEIADEIKRTIFEEIGIIASAGVAPNKFLAKVASDLEKPDGLVFVHPDEVQSFLDPLDISRIWGVGKKTLEKFHRLGVYCVADLRLLSRDSLKRNFGLNSEHFWRLARGEDSRPVVPDRIAKSISHENTFHTDIASLEVLSAWASELADQVARRLRRHEIRGRTVQLKLRFSNFQTITRSMTLKRSSSTTEEIRAAAEQLLTNVNLENRSIRLLGVGVHNLDRGQIRQQMLFGDDELKKQNRLDQTTDDIKDKFGNIAVQRASSLQHKIRRGPNPKTDS